MFVVFVVAPNFVKEKMNNILEIDVLSKNEIQNVGTIKQKTLHTCETKMANAKHSQTAKPNESHGDRL